MREDDEERVRFDAGVAEMDRALMDRMLSEDTRAEDLIAIGIGFLRGRFGIAEGMVSLIDGDQGVDDQVVGGQWDGNQGDRSHRDPERVLSLSCQDDGQPLSGMIGVRLALEVHGRSIGMLTVLLDPGGSRTGLSPSETHAVRRFADHLALSLENLLRQSRLRQANSDLARQVAQRTAEAERADDELTRFVFLVSHDLRAPLRGIQGFSEALLEDFASDLVPLAREYLASIGGAASQMDGLIQALLTYSRFRRAEVIPGPVLLEAVVRDALVELAAKLEQRGARVRVIGELPKVLGSHQILVRVVVSLLDNAVTYVAPETVPEVVVSCEVRRELAYLYVRDNGIGIGAQDQERIFLPLQRLHGVEEYPGSGIGLAIVREGILRLGGHVGLESELGAGSRFWIALQSPAHS